MIQCILRARRNQHQSAATPSHPCPEADSPEQCENSCHGPAYPAAANLIASLEVTALAVSAGVGIAVVANGGVESLVVAKPCVAKLLLTSLVERLCVAGFPVAGWGSSGVVDSATVEAWDSGALAGSLVVSYSCGEENRFAAVGGFVADANRFAAVVQCADLPRRPSQKACRRVFADRLSSWRLLPPCDR